MAAIVESADDGMVRLGPGGAIQTWNRGAARLYGYVGDEAVGTSIELVVPPDHVVEMRAVMERVARGESVQGHETVRLTRDGRRIDVSLTLSPVRDDDGVIVAVAEIARDITEAKALELALRQSQKLESVGRLAGGIAHDFNNLLTGVIGFSEVTLARLEPEHAVRPFVEEVKRAGERATALTQRLLAFGRRQSLRPQLLDLNRVVGELEPLLERLIGEPVEVRLELDRERCSLQADRGQLEQIVMNLALNARDAMPGGGRLTIATGHGSVPERGDYVRLTISDTGTGMDAATQAQIFEPFFTTKEEGKGTGLGLSTVFGIVRQNDGLITVDSELGDGTTFTVMLPGSDEEPELEPAEGDTPSTVSGSGTVLVVEDDDGVRALVQGVLERGGYHVRATGDPRAALELAQEPFDLLLTDMRMPGMTGSELAGQLPGRRVLFMSGYTGEDVADAANFLAKPFTPNELVERVGRLLA
jgi:PAS domain S-box-containing protein